MQKRGRNLTRERLAARPDGDGGNDHDGESGDFARLEKSARVMCPLRINKHM
jgi:hypothetical protein